jgi:hypothetical protein
MDDYQRHPGVDAYIEALPEWQRDICRQLRDIAHEAAPDIEETIKRRVQPYFVLHGNVCALLAAKDHVNLSSTTAPSCPTPTTSSQPDTTTRPPAPSPSTATAPSLGSPWPICCARSPTTTVRAVGASSRTNERPASGRRHQRHVTHVLPQSEPIRECPTNGVSGDSG